MLTVHILALLAFGFSILATTKWILAILMKAADDINFGVWVVTFSWTVTAFLGNWFNIF